MFGFEIKSYHWKSSSAFNTVAYPNYFPFSSSKTHLIAKFTLIELVLAYWYSFVTREIQFGSSFRDSLCRRSRCLTFSALWKHRPSPLHIFRVVLYQKSLTHAHTQLGLCWFYVRRERASLSFAFCRSSITSGSARSEWERSGATQKLNGIKAHNSMVFHSAVI